MLAQSIYWLAAIGNHRSASTGTRNGPKRVRLVRRLFFGSVTMADAAEAWSFAFEETRKTDPIA
jgi:hypothetical protein